MTYPFNHDEWKKLLTELELKVEDHAATMERIKRRTDFLTDILARKARRINAGPYWTDDTDL